MMVCDKCGLPLLGSEAFCPQCGAAVEEPSPPEAQESEAAPSSDEGPAAHVPTGGEEKAPAAAPRPEGPPVVEAVDVPLEVPRSRRPRAAAPVSPRMAEPRPVPSPPLPTLRHVPQGLRARLMGPLGLGLLAGCLVLFIFGLGALGAVQGLRMRSQSLNDAAATHYQRGLVHLSNGEYELAADEFEYALRLRPEYPEAQQKLIEARSKAAQQPSPSPAASQEQSSTLLAEGRAAYDRGAWDEAIEKLEALHNMDPTYEQATVQRLLVGAYANSGLMLVNEGGMEEAIRRFDQALTLQPDNPDVQLQRRLAALYQGGMSVWGVDWSQAITSFSAVYALKPDYKDIPQRLLQAYVQAGDAAGAASAWCDAVQYYKAALDLSPAQDVTTKRDDAAHRCASPTGVPGGTPVPAGTYVGSFAGLEDNRQRTTSWSKVQGRVLNAKGEGMPNVQVKIQAYDWSAIHTTDATGYYAFEFLNNEVTFTVTLIGLPVQPVDVPTKFGYGAVANFDEKP